MTKQKLSQDPGAARFSWWLQCVVGLIVLLGAGCGKDVAEDAGESDANGYACRACETKFYTERKVFASNCPGCKSTDLAPVVGFLCPKDGNTTITPRKGDSMPCEKCGEKLENIRMPHEKELRAWGAAKKTKAEVIP